MMEDNSTLQFHAHKVDAFNSRKQFYAGSVILLLDEFLGTFMQKSFLENTKKYFPFRMVWCRQCLLISTFYKMAAMNAIPPNFVGGDLWSRKWFRGGIGTLS